MKKNLLKIIEIPEGVEVNINENIVFVKGKEGENKKNLPLEGIELENKKDKIILKKDNGTKKDKRIINTMSTHLKNMIQGVQKKFEYQLKIVFNHFPITVKVENQKAIIKNFLGERKDRTSKILDNVDVEIKKDIIIVKSVDKEAAGQTSANFEAATKIKNRDRRVFQDGIFLINKAGKEI